MLPLALVQDVKNWPMVIGFYGTVLIAAASAARFARTGRPSVPVVLVINLMLPILVTRIAGPFVLTPLVICAGLASITSIRWINERTAVVLGWTALAVMIPIVGEAIGLMPQTWMIGDGMMVIISDVVHSHGRVTELSLVAINLLFTLVLGWFILSISRRRRVAQQQLYVQAWHLRQLLPSAKRPPATDAR